MKQGPDRKKLRREYLRKKGTGTVLTTASVLLITVGTLMTLTAFLLYSVGGGYRGAQEWFSVLPGFGEVGSNVAWMFVTALFLVAMAAGMLGLAVCLNKRGHSLLYPPYVPPVTPNTLPAEEILVRGSEEPPVVQSEVLLRAAQGEETPKEELLRVAKE